MIKKRTTQNETKGTQGKQRKLLFLGTHYATAVSVVGLDEGTMDYSGATHLFLKT